MMLDRTADHPHRLTTGVSGSPLPDHPALSDEANRLPSPLLAEGSDQGAAKHRHRAHA
jgi:hypothetical protein